MRRRKKKSATEENTVPGIQLQVNGGPKSSEPSTQVPPLLQATLKQPSCFSQYCPRNPGQQRQLYDGCNSNTHIIQIHNVHIHTHLQTRTPIHPHIKPQIQAYTNIQLHIFTCHCTHTDIHINMHTPDAFLEQSIPLNLRTISSQAAEETFSSQIKTQLFRFVCLPC